MIPRLPLILPSALALAACLSPTLLAQEATPETIQAAVQKQTYKNIGEVTLQLHLFLPPGHQPTDKKPAIVFFFGGGWNGGSPSQFYRQSWYLSQRGMVAACAEYRIKSKHQTTPKECVADGKSAVRFLRKNAAKFGIDPDKIVAAGGSAGGHVAAATATVTKINEPGEDTSVSAVPNALVLFNPVLDNGPEGWGHDRVKDYWKDISPMHNVTKGIPPSLFMLGDEDKLIPVATGTQFQKVVQEAGGRCDLNVYPKQPHGFFNTGESFRSTLDATDRFLASLGYLEGPPQIKLVNPVADKR